jgi:hypothetical protein
MYEPQTKYRSWGPGGSGFGGDTFPGIGESFSGPPALVNPTVLPVQAAAATATKAGGFSLANLGEIKNVIDRMGGIDGILSTVGKVQKFMSTMQQMAPLLKLFMKKKGKGSNAASTDDDYEYRPRRRRRPSGKRAGKRSLARRRTGSGKRR